MIAKATLEILFFGGEQATSRGRRLGLAQNPKLRVTDCEGSTTAEDQAVEALHHVTEIRFVASLEFRDGAA